MEPFTAAEVERARRYHRPLYVLLASDAAITTAVLLALTRLDLPLPWWAEVVAGPAAVAAALWCSTLPTAWWRRRHELAWDLTTQETQSWARDRLRGLAVGVVLTVVAVGGLLTVAHALPNGWPWPSAAAGALLAVTVSFLAPVVLEPVFNRFRPLEGALAEVLRTLSVRAGVPVRDVLVADASRRTRKVNAYVSGLGRTRRVVLWDTLLASPDDEIAVVVAHELGHRRLRHVARGTAIAAGGAVAFVAALRLVTAHPQPDDAALVLLVAWALELVALPFSNALSRRWERAADRFSVDVTRDSRAFRSVHRRLALSNLADLEPPQALYVMTASHPTPPQRIHAVEHDSRT